MKDLNTLINDLLKVWDAGKRGLVTEDDYYLFCSDVEEKIEDIRDYMTKDISYPPRDRFGRRPRPYSKSNKSFASITKE